MAEKEKSNDKKTPPANENVKENMDEHQSLVFNQEDILKAAREAEQAVGDVVKNMASTL